jgi:hypothetical protein
LHVLLRLLILLDFRNCARRAVLAEAKVSTDTGSPRTIYDKWDDFLELLGGDSSKTSSLFVQLYRKVRLTEQTTALNQGLPHDAFARRWSLGNNWVVRSSAALLAEYRPNPWYLAIGPDRHEAVAAFFSDVLHNFHPDAARPPNWNVNHWGFLSWPSLHQHVRRQGNTWPQLISSFEWNQRRGPVPVPPQEVMILARGWETSQVMQVDAGNQAFGSPFHIFNHHVLIAGPQIAHG